MCTCETYGHCHECGDRMQPCGQHVEVDPANPCEDCAVAVLTEEREYQYGDMVQSKYTNHRCVWCLEWFKTKDMFTVGNWMDKRKVCGPECPDRPEVPPLCIHPVGFVRKGAVVQMPAKGRFTRMDTCTKCGQTRQVAWAKTHTIRDWGWS